MDSHASPPPPLLASSPRSALPEHPLHGKATGSPPPPPLLTSAPRSPLTHGQATGAPMDMETPPPAPAAAATFCPPSYTAEWIFRDFACRRAALIRALTSDEKAFSRKCNKGTETLYLYGNSDGSWEVRPQKLFMPQGQHEPATLGIKLVRGDMKRTKWLRYIAMHCDTWLIRISYFLGASLETRSSRQRLSDRINSLQTVLESFIASDTYHRILNLEKMNEDEDEGCGTEPTICASCGSRYHLNGFWICCDVCDRWFHGKCVKITAAQAKSIEHYECPECCSDKKGHDYNVDPMLSILYKRY